MPLPMPRSNEQRDDFISRCAGSNIMLDEYPDTQQRIAVCESQWARRTMENKHVTIRNQMESYAVRNETLEGRPHLVVPVTILTEGVHCGSAGCYYYGPELLQQSAAAWNGMPVPINHPCDDQGQPISCQDPSVINQTVVGRLFNVRVNGNRLKGELWLSEERLRDKAPEIMERISNRDMIEVSTGLVPIRVGNGGDWNGEEYQGSIEQLQPDHLAILPDVKGACSIDDGCGIRNKEGKIKKLYLVSNQTSLNNQEGFIELRDKLQTVLDRMDSQVAYHYLVEMYDDHIIYEVKRGSMPVNENVEGYFKAAYQVADDGSITLGNPERVIKETRFIEASGQNQLASTDKGNQSINQNKKGDKNMGKECLVNSLIQCERTQWTEDDRDKLLQFNEEDLEKMAPVAEAKPPDDGADASPDAPEDAEAAAPEGEGDDQANNAEAFLKTVPEDVRDVFESGIKLHNAQRHELIQKILNADGNQWTQEDLETMKLEQLQKMSALVKSTPSYIGMAGGPVDNAEDNEPLEIPSLEKFFQEAK